MNITPEVYITQSGAKRYKIDLSELELKEIQTVITLVEKRRKFCREYTKRVRAEKKKNSTEEPKKMGYAPKPLIHILV